MSAGGADEPSLGLIDTRSAVLPCGSGTVPAVSTVTWRPAAPSPVRSVAISPLTSGSPPVTTTCRRSVAVTASRIAATDIARPSGRHDVKGVSHHTQRRLQPLVRTNTLGVPASIPSPWSDG